MIFAKIGTAQAVRFLWTQVTLHLSVYPETVIMFRRKERLGEVCVLRYGVKLSQSSITNNFLCITHTVEHNYISPNSTVGIQLHVSALYVGHLQVVI